MLRCGVAEQQRFALAAHQRRGDRLRVIARIGWRGGSDAFGHSDGRGDLRQRIGPCARCGGHVRRERHRPIVMHRVQARHLCAVTHGLAQSLREQRMVLAQEGADHESAIQLRQRRDARAEPARAARRRGVGEVGMARAHVDVLAAQAAHELGQQVQLFDRGVLRAERADAGGAELADDTLQAVGDVVQRRRPIDRLPRTALLDHRLRQPAVAVQRFVREAVAVGDPALVDVFVFERHHAQHLVGLDLHDQVRAGAVVRAHALAAREFPGSRAVAERLAGQRTNRADIDHVARQLAVDRAAVHGGDLAVLAAVDHAELHHAGHFLAEAHAACAVDAARHLFHRDQRADVLAEDDALFLVVARGAAAVADREILQLAFAALVADRAVERVVDEQELHHRLLRLDRLVALGAHDHAVGHRRGAGRHRLGHLLDVHEAHAAVGRDRSASCDNRSAGCTRPPRRRRASPCCRRRW